MNGKKSKKIEEATKNRENREKKIWGNVGINLKKLDTFNI